MKHRMNLKMPMLFLPILAGCVLGSVLFAISPAEYFWQNALFRQGMGTAAADLPLLLMELLAVPLFWLLCMAVCGTSMIGMPLAYVLLAFRGMAVGAVLCRVYFLQGIAGFLTAVLFIMPYALCSLLIYAAAAEESMRCASAVLSAVQGHGEMDLSLKHSALRYLLLAVALLAVGILQSIWLQYGYPAYLSIMAGK